jgi:NitT/TauT family transport system substrate-binding protein
MRIERDVYWSKELRSFLLEYRLQGWIGIVVMFFVYYGLQWFMPYDPSFRLYGFATPWLMAGIAGATTTLAVLYSTIADFYMRNRFAASESVLSAAKLVRSISLLLTILITAACVYLVIAPVTLKLLVYTYFGQILLLFLLAIFILVIDRRVFRERAGGNSPVLDERRRDIITFDWAVLIAVGLTVVVLVITPHILPARYMSEAGLVDGFLISFKAGAVSFEIMIACIVFDPRPFLQEYKAIYGSDTAPEPNVFVDLLDATKSFFKPYIERTAPFFGSRIKLRLLAIALLFGGVSIIWWIDPAKDTTRLAIATWPGFAIANVAQEEHFFDDLGVDIKVIDDPTARLTAFRSGQMDVTISSLDVFAQESANGIDGRIFMVTDASSGADGIVARPEIRVIADLNGKTVAVAKGTPSHFFLYSLLKKEKLELRSLRLVFFDDPTLAGQAFVSGNVDAAVTWEPLLSEIISKGQGHLLASSADTPDRIVDVLVGSRTFLAERERIQRFVNSWQNAVNFAKAEPRIAGPIVAKSLGMPTPGPNEDVFAGISLADRAVNKRLLCPLSGGSALADTVIAEAQRFWIDQDVISVVKQRPDQLVDRFMCQ